MDRPRSTIILTPTYPISGCVALMSWLILIAIFGADAIALAQSMEMGRKPAATPTRSTGESAARTQIEFPYQALVLKQQAPVHSGPGETHYATDKLAQNSTVAVYRHDPGGWCAIRPPRDSFSLVPATTIELVDENIGRVIDEGTQVWVGTQLGPVDKPLWQIKLKAGELVEIMGEANWPNPQGHSTTWYQIAPPAGEFRWMRLSDLQGPPRAFTENESNAVLSNRVSAESNPASETALTQAVRDTENPTARFPVRPATFQSDDTLPRPTNRLVDQSTSRPVDRASFNNSNNSDTSNDSVNQGWRKASTSIERSENPNSTGAPFSGYSPNDRFAELPVTNATNGGPRVADIAVEPVPSTQDLMSRNFGLEPSLNAIGSGLVGNSTALLTPRLTQLELRLNREMIKEPNQWRLIDLQTEAQTIIQSTTNPLEQAQAQQLLGKLENCARIRENYLAVFQATAIPNGGDDSDLAGVTPTNDISSDISLDTMYDAHGWLYELVRDGGRERSTYVLKDEGGRITHHVSPVPGLSLSPYLKTKIGIKGTRGFHTDLKLDHVTAERIIELKRR